MTMQSQHHGHGWTDNVGVQAAVATIVILAVIAIAWFAVF